MISNFKILPVIQKIKIGQKSHKSQKSWNFEILSNPFPIRLTMLQRLQIHKLKFQHIKRVPKKGDIWPKTKMNLVVLDRGSVLDRVLKWSDMKWERGSEHRTLPPPPAHVFFYWNMWLLLWCLLKIRGSINDMRLL